MKEAFGGTWLLGFVVLFIVLFSAYLAISVNYTKAFKAKNKIINIIEQSEGFTESDSWMVSNLKDSELLASNKAEDKIYYYLKQAGFAIDVNDSRCPEGAYMQEGGYCISKVCTNQGAYYKVTTFIQIELPVIWQTFTIPIKGETKVLYYTNDDIGCQEGFDERYYY